MKSINSLISRVKNHRPVETYDDEFLNWLRFANAGMLHPGNIFAMKYAIDRLPTNDAVIEIGSFCGLSTNVISYFLKGSGRKNVMYCSDKWEFENANKDGNVGNSDTAHSDYSAFVKASFIRNLTLFSGRNPFPVELFSDDFFKKWSDNAKVVDVFNRDVKLGGGISFCYVDGNHSYDYVKRDFQNIDKFLVRGGYILFDDSSDGNPFGLTRLMKEIKKTSGYRVVMKNPNYLFEKV